MHCLLGWVLVPVGILNPVMCYVACNRPLHCRTVLLVRLLLLMTELLWWCCYLLVLVHSKVVVDHHGVGPLYQYFWIGRKYLRFRTVFIPEKYWEEQIQPHFNLNMQQKESSK
jgi:hypothetical protein